MFEPSVKVKRELWERIRECAASAGYSAPEEFVLHVLEREVAKLEDAQRDDAIARHLKGLGYLE